MVVAYLKVLDFAGRTEKNYEREFGFWAHNKTWHAPIL